MTVGVVVMAYGTPAGPEQVEEYYTHIRRGRPPEPAQLSELVGRYAAIGGISPLAERTRAQVDAIGAALGAGPTDGNGGGTSPYRVTLGQKHAAPFIEDAVADLVAGGDVDQVVGLVLAPHYSGSSVGQYHARAGAAAGDLPFVGIDQWHLEPALLEFQATAVRRALDDLPPRTHVLFTAHSLPERVLAGDPYPDQLRESAEATAARAGVTDWDLGWQSAGRTPEPWRGPDILQIIRDLAVSGRHEGLLVVPQGFTSDHLEVLYDLDIEAATVAGEVGLQFGRTDVLNADPAAMAALAALVRTATVSPRS